MRFVNSSLSGSRSAATRKRPLLGGLALLTTLVIAALVGFLIGPFSSRAVQDPILSLDMDPSGNTYDDATNTMSVGPIDFCLETAAPGDNATHNHTAQVVIQNVEDMIGWQMRVNYDGGMMRPNSVQFAPFTDNNTLQPVSFVNLPIDSGTSVHRDLLTASNIPPAASGPQSGAFGSTYLATQTAEVSPDTPPKATSDGGAYSAPSGGILAALQYQVLAGNAGNSGLVLDVDDANPNSPGSGISFFNGTGSQEFPLTEAALGDGYHAEGTACGAPTPVPSAPTPTATVPPTPSSTPTITANPSPGPGGTFRPQDSATYCLGGTGDIDDQQLTVSCQPGATAGDHADVVSSFDLPAEDYYLAGAINFSPTLPDDSSIPVASILGRIAKQPTFGLVNNPCNNSFLRVPFTLLKGTTDINDTVEPRPFGESNDLAIMAGDNPPYNGQQDVKPAPAVTKYPSFLNAIFDPDWVDYGPDRIAGNADDNNGPAPPLTPVLRAVGTTSIPAAGNLWVIIQLVTFEKGTNLPNLPAIDPAYGYPTVLVLQTSSVSGSATPPAPSVVTDSCTPLNTVSVSYGVTKDNPDTPANEGAIPIRTLPANGTEITSFNYYASLRDADGDTFENPIDPCPFIPDTVWNPHLPPQGDSDMFSGTSYPDGIPDTCDPTPNEATAGEPSNQPTDHDGDGYPNRGDNCALVANGGAQANIPGVGNQTDTDKNEAGEEVGDGIGDACDPNPGTPDGREIKCVKKGTVTIGGDPNVAYTDCLDSTPPIIDGTPTPTATPNFGPGTYRPIYPTRILDTRSGPGSVGKVGPGGMKIVDLTGVGGVPSSGVSAVALNVTVTDPTEASYLTVFPLFSDALPPPNEVPLPSTSNLNFTAGQTIANMVIVPVGADGNVIVYNKAGSVHVIVDVAGWYTGP
jgi:hypothetical protein